MYGLWLYKELKTEYGFAKVEVFRKGYTASAIEIGALVGDSLTLALENLSSITDPIGKSVCSFEIYDTNQVEYDDLFTPDATAYKVVVSTKLDGGNYTTRWSGYVTPDFFAESLSYRTPISISARDNIGYLNDVDFDLDVATITVRELIVAAFNRIAEDYPMSLVFETTKQTEEGILAIDATISTALLKDKSWYDAIETILHDLGMQMRWVDNNTIAVLDVSQLGEKFGLQKFNFIDKSGYREILPAWRELNQKQDYGLRENFFEGWLKNNALAFVKSQSVKLPIPIGQAGAGSSATMKYYAPNNWGVAGNTYTINTEDFAYLGAYGQATTPFGKRIYFTGVDKADTTIAQNYMSWRQNVYKSNDRMQITFKAFNSLLGTSHNSPDTLLAYNPAERFLGINLGLTTGDYIQLGLKVNLFLHVGTKTYIMRETWEEISGAETSSLYFVLDKMGDISGDNIPKEQEISIGIGNIPASGQLELRIYGFTLEDKKNLQEDAKLATYDWLRMVSYIDDVTYSYAESNKKTGVVSGVEIASLHNIKASEDYTFGQITLFSGGINAYAGGLYKANGDELVGFRRDASSTTYPLLELVGREIIHFNKKNYTKLSGTAKNLAAEPLMFNKLLVYKGKNYLPYACSLDVISNTMNITTMQEVEPYATQSFAEIKSELVTGGGATVSGGNNTALQYSAEVGNAKRISELNNASESEKKESYIIVDNASWNESKKVPLNEMEGLNEAELTEFLTANKYATQPWVSGIAKGLADDLANRVLIADFEKLEGTVNGNYQSINILNGKVGTLEGYFTKGVANDSAKLGGQLPSYYATASALDTTNSNLSALTTRVGNTEDAITSIQNTYVDKGSAQTITGVKTFQNGLKIGDIKLEWDSANQALKIIGNAYVTELFSMGKISESGSGGGGTASAAVRIMLGETPYDAVNGVVNLPAYPSLNGYATEGWVGANYQPKGNYLTLVGWGDINNKPTTALGYDITDVITTNGFSLRAESNRTWGTLISANGYTTRYWLDSVSGGGIGISDYADKTYIQINGEYYANEGRSLVLHTANYGDYALPLSGGKISGTTNTPLVVGTSATKEVGIRLDMLDGNKAWIGYTPTTGVYLYHYNGSHILGIKDDGTPNYNGNTLIHSGNIGSYTSGNSNAVGGYGADSLWRSDGGVWNPSANIKLEASSNGQEWSFDIARNGYTGCYWHVWDSNWGSMLLVNADDGSVKAPYGFVGNLSGNASSATKLQTARSIWGQSFDGTGNLDGVFTLYYDNNTRATGIEILSTNGGESSIGFTLNSNTRAVVGCWGNMLNLWRQDFGTILSVPSSGNVLIGSTTDNGAKLQVATNDDYPIRATLSSHTSTYRHAFGGYSPNMVSGDYVSMEVGKSTSYCNTAYLAYMHSADNSSGNYLSLGMYGVNDILRLYGDRTFRLNHEGGNYSEGMRLTNIAGSSYTWSEINFGCEVGSDSGTHPYQWTVGRNGNNNCFVIRNYQYDRFTIDLSGNVSFAGNIWTEGTIAMAKLASSSDVKLKYNIKWLSADKSMEVVRALRPTEWNWKIDSTHSFGFIAQDVQPIVPEMVSSINDTLRLEYNQLHAFEIGAIQHIDSEVEQLKKKVARLENELNEYRRNAQWQ